VELPRADAADSSVPAARFGCFLGVDATELTDSVIRGLARGLLAAGAVYFATWENKWGYRNRFNANENVA
jgi:hypothetical protein